MRESMEQTLARLKGMIHAPKSAILRALCEKAGIKVVELTLTEYLHPTGEGRG